MKKYRQPVSPERAKVWKERSPKYHQALKVAVVYYLCRNRQLEQPHFIEVPLSSPNGLYLRDVINRLNILRGKGMASIYSWSCKRSYKSGFVWHDLSEDDLISPAHGSEYVLKGSELVEELTSGCSNPAKNMKLQNTKLLPEPSSSRSRDESSSSSSMNGGDGKNSQDDELSPTLQGPGSSTVSSDSMDGKTSPWNGPLSLTEYKIYKSDGLADASTQTDENISKTKKPSNTCTRGVSTDDGSSEQDVTEPVNKATDVSPPPSSSSATSSGGKTETLESLIRADASKFKSFRIPEEDEFRAPPHSKLRASNVLMQLISCGSISVKDHSFGLIPTYRPRFSNSKFPSPLFSTSLLLGELDCLSENPRITGMRLEEKEYFSGSLIEKNLLKEGGDRFPSLKRSSSYNADRSCKQLDVAADEQEATSPRSKCIPCSIKGSISKNPKSESMRSPISDKPRTSADGPECSRSIAASSSSNASSRRFTDPSLTHTQATKTDSFREDKENVIKIDES